MAGTERFCYRACMANARNQPHPAAPQSAADEQRTRLAELLHEGLDALEAGQVVSKDEYDAAMEQILSGKRRTARKRARG